MHTWFCYAAPPEHSLVEFSGDFRPEHSKLLAHMYGLKNLYASLIRFYAAYYIANPQVYDLATYTFAAVAFCFLTEWGLWQSVRSRELAIPLFTAVVGFVWMMRERDFYVQ
jgi:hypothetical protein